jgi:hypothetical protein
LYQFMDNSCICLNGTNQIEVRNQIELTIMTIKNIC